MGTEPIVTPPADDDDETIFETLLEKKGATWLQKALKELGMTANPSNPSPSNPQTAGAFESFLREQLQEQKSHGAALKDQLEKVLDLLTPEQRTLLRSPPPAPVVDPQAHPKKEPSAPLAPQPQKRKFLSRI